MSSLELISIFLSAFSVALASVALYLSVKFFFITKKASDETKNTSKEISSSITMLNSVVTSLNTLVSDTLTKLTDDMFSTIREVLTKASDQVFVKQPSPSDIGAGQALINKGVADQVKSVLAQKGIGSEEEQNKVAKELEQVVESFISSPDTRTDTNNYITEVIRSNQPITVKKLTALLDMQEENLVINHLFPLRESGRIIWNGQANRLTRYSEIRLTDEQNKS